MNLKLIKDQAKLNIKCFDKNDIKGWARGSINTMYRAINFSLNNQEIKDYNKYTSKMNMTVALVPVDTNTDKTVARVYIDLFKSYIKGAERLQHTRDLENTSYPVESHK